MIPARITDTLVDTLARSRPDVAFVVHINHPNEIDAELSAALAHVARSGIPVMNQAVLLRGVNDAIDTLVALSEALFSAHVLPYYLHVLDPVSGAAHFAVDTPRIAALGAALRARLPGYLVPRIVREIAGEPSKTPFA